MRTAVTVNDNAPPQWRGRTGWITENRPGGFHLVELKGGGQVLLHDSEIERQAPAEPSPDAVQQWQQEQVAAVRSSGAWALRRLKDATAEPETVTAMVGHCAVAVPASVAPRTRAAPPDLLIQERHDLYGQPCGFTLTANRDDMCFGDVVPDRSVETITRFWGRAQQWFDSRERNRLAPKPDKD